MEHFFDLIELVEIPLSSTIFVFVDQIKGFDEL